MARFSKKLSSEVLAEVWSDKRRGSQVAVDQLVEHYGYIVANTCKKLVPDDFSYPEIDKDDLRQEAALGLIKAINQYDFRPTVQFDSYAISMVRGAVLEALRQADWVPRSVRDKQKSLLRAENQYLIMNGQPACRAEEMADYLGMPVDTFVRYRSDAVVRQMQSIDEPVFMDRSDYGELTERREVNLVSDAEPLDERSIASLRRIRLLEAIFKLSENEKFVVLLYHYEGHTFKEIAKLLRLSESRIFQIHLAALEHLKRYFCDLDALSALSLQSVRIRRRSSRQLN